MARAASGTRAIRPTWAALASARGDWLHGGEVGDKPGDPKTEIPIVLAFPAPSVART
jgi:hypothetical protein